MFLTPFTAIYGVCFGIIIMGSRRTEIMSGKLPQKLTQKSKLSARMAVLQTSSFVELRKAWHVQRL